MLLTLELFPGQGLGAFALGAQLCPRNILHAYIFPIEIT